MSKVLIPFSGGIDSTNLAYQNLKKGNEVYLDYYEILNNTEKTVAEKNAVMDIVEVLREEFDHHSVHLTIGSKTSGFCVGARGSTVSTPQPLLWLMGVIYSGDIDEVDEVQKGYVMGDHSISFIPEIKRIYKNCCEFFHYSSEMPSLTFPLVKEHKIEVWNGLPEYLRRRTVFCEKSEKRYTPCGECGSWEEMIEYGLWTDWHRLNGIESVPRVYIDDERMEGQG